MYIHYASHIIEMESLVRLTHFLCMECSLQLVALITSRLILMPSLALEKYNIIELNLSFIITPCYDFKIDYKHIYTFRIFPFVKRLSYGIRSNSEL